MKPELHPDAAKNFNAKARALLDKVAAPTEAMQAGVPTHFVRPGGHAHVLPEGEPGSFRLTGMHDQLTGRTTARYFEHQGMTFGLEGERYQELARLSEGLQKTNQLRDIVGAEWVEDRILDWIEDFIAERCEEDVKEHELWFPVAQLSLESERSSCCGSSMWRPRPCPRWSPTAPCWAGRTSRSSGSWAWKAEGCTEMRKVIGNPILNFHLSDEEISRYKRIFGFDGAGELLKLERRTDFQEKLLDALLLYSSSTREKDLAGRLVYMLVAIETMLLKDENEPIQQNIGERMAFMTGDNLEARRAKIRHLRDAYGLRSKFIHHGETMAEIEAVRAFMLDAWTLFTTLLKDIHRYDTKAQFIDRLDARRLS